MRVEPQESLPAWLYSDPGFFELEREQLFRSAWQLVCHLNDVPRPGDFQTFAFLGEQILTLRGDDGRVRSFHNVCRHRGMRLVEGTEGNCGRRLVCPYHAWSYALDGRVALPPRWRETDGGATVAHDLAPLEQEIWRGFVFVRFAPGDHSVAEMMAPYDAELAPHGLEDLQPQGRVVLRPRPVNWKNIADNYGDALHIPVAHPGLTRLFDGSYYVEAEDWVDKMAGVITGRPSANWCERQYQGLLGAFDHLPGEMRRTWSYYRLWPNLAFDVYPDQMDFMQFIPISPTQTLIREISYVRPDARRAVKAARYLNWRINRQVNAEDTVLIARLQSGMGSSSYSTGPLAADEVGLASFAQRLRAAIPEARRAQPAPMHA
ncbi:MAG: aromatic ring-hydroxylating dioxygenase subunit alpha [Phenylobacterium sp.]|nr:MAG: aromatic ring-hydroxylating dioxygenase subunit alpha [Phenylobacterium sp.]